MKGQRLSALLILAAVTIFVYDNGPDPVSDGCVRIVDEKGLVGYAKPDGTVIIEPRFAFGFPFVDGIARVTQKGKRVEVPGSSANIIVGRATNGSASTKRVPPLNVREGQNERLH